MQEIQTFNVSVSTSSIYLYYMCTVKDEEEKGNKLNFNIDHHDCLTTAFHTASRTLHMQDKDSNKCRRKVKNPK